MEKLEDAEKIAAAELLVLQAMCQGTPEGSVCKEALALLADYSFRDAVNQLIFDTLREIPTDRPEMIREQLPARLLATGFPDLALDRFFAPHGLSAQQALDLMRWLRASSQRKKESF